MGKFDEVVHKEVIPLLANLPGAVEHRGDSYMSFDEIRPFWCNVRIFRFLENFSF